MDLLSRFGSNVQTDDATHTHIQGKKNLLLTHEADGQACQKMAREPVGVGIALVTRWGWVTVPV